MYIYVNVYLRCGVPNFRWPLHGSISCRGVSAGPRCLRSRTTALEYQASWWLFPQVRGPSCGRPYGESSTVWGLYEAPRFLETPW